jgi:hypothetical protein
MVASAHGTVVRDDVADGQVGRWDRYDRQAYQDGDRDGAHLEVPKYCREGNANPGSGRARAISAGGTSVPQGASFDQRDMQFLENKFTAIQADMNAMLAQLAKPHATREQ